MSTTDRTDPADIPVLATGGIIYANLDTHITASELTGNLVGRYVTVASPQGEWSITGRLWRVEHHADTVSEKRLCDDEDTVHTGRRLVDLDIGPFSFAPHTTAKVVVHPEGARS